MKLISADSNVDIFPERRSFSGTGHFVLQNKYPTPISQVHISDAHPGAFGAINIEPSVSDVSFNRPFHVASVSSNHLYTIYQFDTPVAPGDTVDMAFRVGHTTRGFRDGHEMPEFVYSGTFFDQAYFPNIGYDTGVEIQDPRRRREEHLGELTQLPPRGDPWGSLISVDYIKYHTTVSTSDSDNEGKPQTAISPGYLQKDWHQDGRHYFTYDMGDVPMAAFFNFNSARYDVTRAAYQGVNGPINIEVYHIPAHTYDVDDMIQASKAGLAYYEKNYGPYQFKQYRILEYPRYRTFAESFPNTIPFSEAIGFIDRVVKPDDIDYCYFVTAHELAHQWWGHQLTGGNVEGSNMMSESLAEYSALRVMEKKYGSENMRKFLSYELDGYLRGRSGELRHENALVLVQNETYVWYQKGSLVLYALSDYIGEDKLNLALHNFLMQHQYPNANASQVSPYPDTRQFVDALRAATPPEYQYYITDAFEHIVLYDNKAITATYTPTADGKYKVILTVQAKKVKADGSGNESPMTMNDYIDIAVFSGKKDHEKQLYLKRERVSQERQTYEIVVNEQPTRAGIDPYNKLIDRVSGRQRNRREQTLMAEMRALVVTVLLAEWWDERSRIAIRLKCLADRFGFFKQLFVPVCVSLRMSSNYSVVLRPLLASALFAPLFLEGCGGGSKAATPSTTTPPVVSNSCTTAPVTITHTAAANNPQLVVLDRTKYPAAVCNDGTSGAYVLRSGAGAAANRWILSLQGGGECFDQATCSTRSSSMPTLISTASFQANPSTAFGQGGLLGTTPGNNPDFYDASVVQVLYCSSDDWSGNKVGAGTYSPTDPTTWNWQGRAILNAVIADLTASHGLSSATEVMLTGQSAGGVGVFANANPVARLIPAGVRYVAYSDAGFPRRRSGLFRDGLRAQLHKLRNSQSDLQTHSGSALVEWHRRSSVLRRHGQRSGLADTLLQRPDIAGTPPRARSSCQCWCRSQKKTPINLGPPAFRRLQRRVARSPHRRRDTSRILRPACARPPARPTPMSACLCRTSSSMLKPQTLLTSTLRRHSQAARSACNNRWARGTRRRARSSATQRTRRSLLDSS